MSIEKHTRWLKDIVANADKVASYIAGLDRAAFESDEKTVDAVERCLQRVTEAAIRLKDRAQELLPGHDWAGIRSLGNHLRHQYDTIRKDILWDIITTDLPRLRAECVSAVARLEAEQKPG